MIRRYAEFDLWVRPDPNGNGYWADASFGLKSAQENFQKPFTEQELDAFRKAVSQGRGRTLESRRLARQLGEKLFKAVFADSLRDLWNQARRESWLNRGLRLRIRPTPEVSHWPWELFHSRRRYLALSIRTPIVRHVEDPQTQRAQWVPWPLRILVVISSPRGCEDLDGAKELKVIQDALARRSRLGLVRVERLEPATLDSLADRLELERFDVLHFIGHGKFDGDEGVLLFEEPDGSADPVDGESLANALSGSIRLIVLNACDGACNSPDDPYSGMAQNLVRRGIPAVVAMQCPIEDAKALRFSRRLYAGLARGWPVDRAVTRARKAIQRGLDWTIPVLFLSSRSGYVISLRPPWKWVALALVLLCLVYWRSTQSPMQPCPPLQGVEIEFVRIPAGSFMMGSEGREKDEKPRHEVKISRPFCLGVYEVTRQQWESVMGADSMETDVRQGDLPITSVTWEQVQEFIDAINKRAGDKVVRLATEAEWEYAARGPSGLPAGFTCLHNQIDGLAPVGTLRPNRWGLHDMLGNAWEWVEDWYGSYPQGTVTDPHGPPSGTARIKRGGGFDSAAKHCRAANRSQEEPNRRAKNLGFRLACDLDTSSDAGRH